jgi:hypothetical protein
VRTGIWYESEVPGWVPDFELREAAVFCHYTPEEFWTLHWSERAAAVAQFRLHKLVELHEQDAVSRAVERESRRRGRR